jgi:hypothetical protein
MASSIVGPSLDDLGAAADVARRCRRWRTGARIALFVCCSQRTGVMGYINRHTVLLHIPAVYTRCNHKHHHCRRLCPCAGWLAGALEVRLGSSLHCLCPATCCEHTCERSIICKRLHTQSTQTPVKPQPGGRRLHRHKQNSAREFKPQLFVFSRSIKAAASWLRPMCQ